MEANEDRDKTKSSRDALHDPTRGLMRQTTSMEHMINSGRMPRRSVFIDFETMKMNISRNLCKPKYNTKDYYHATGYVQAIAKSWQFEYVGFIVIGLNALWVAIDTDYNKASALNEAPIGFQIMEHGFCAYFFVEWIIRFFAFISPVHAFMDWWMLFDTALVALMVAETWLLSIVLAITGSSSRSGLKNASVLKLVRLLRIARVARVARVLKEVPELMILLKGMAAAMRSVCFTLFLLVGVIYVFGIAFAQLTEDTSVGQKYFDSVAESMLTLLLRGTYLDEITEIMNDMKEESVYLVILFLVFVLIAAQTLMNMLIGILCEVVSQVALIEKEEIKMHYASQRLHTIMEDLDIDHDMTINKKEFIKMMSNKQAVQALADVGVDALRLVDFVDIIFAEETDLNGALSYNAFVNVVLQFRGANPCTVKDLLETQKALRYAIKGVANYLKFMAEKSFGPGVKAADISGAHLGANPFVSEVGVASEVSKISTGPAFHRKTVSFGEVLQADATADDNDTVSNASHHNAVDSTEGNLQTSMSRQSFDSLRAGHSSMRAILKQLSEEIQQNEDKAKKEQREKDHLVKENNRLRELLKKMKGCSESSPVKSPLTSGFDVIHRGDNTDKDSNATCDDATSDDATCDDLNADNQLVSLVAGRTHCRLVRMNSRVNEDSASLPTTMDGDVLEPPRSAFLPGAVSVHPPETGEPSAPTNQAPLMPLHAPLESGIRLG